MVSDPRSSPRWTLERRHYPPIVCRPWLALIAAGLALVVYVKDGQAETVKGLVKSAAYVLTRNPPCKPECPRPLVLEFTIKFPLPDRMDREWW